MKNKYNIKELEDKLNKCKDIKFEDINTDNVDEISTIKIDRKKSSNEKILDFLTKVKNLYVFKVSSRLVRIQFSDTSKTVKDCLTNVFKNLYR